MENELEVKLSEVFFYYDNTSEDDSEWGWRWDFRTRDKFTVELFERQKIIEDTMERHDIKRSGYAGLEKTKDAVVSINNAIRQDRIDALKKDENERRVHADIMQDKIDLVEDLRNK